MFRAWNAGWNKHQRKHAWQNFARMVVQNGMKVLMATHITCDHEDDEKSWEWTKEFMMQLGTESVMGFAIGNELELLYTQENAPQNCIRQLWDGGGLWRTFQKRVKDIDEMGFSHVPVTSVFTGGILYTGYPFVNIKGQALVGDFLANVTNKYGKRYAFTFNIYPYFDDGLRLDPGSNHTCTLAMKKALCWTKGCLAHEAMLRARRRMKALTNREDDLFWIGEIGWSAPHTDSLFTEMPSAPPSRRSKPSRPSMVASCAGTCRWT